MLSAISHNNVLLVVACLLGFSMFLSSDHMACCCHACQIFVHHTTSSVYNVYSPVDELYVKDPNALFTTIRKLEDRVFVAHIQTMVSGYRTFIVIGCARPWFMTQIGTTVSQLCLCIFVGFRWKKLTSMHSVHVSFTRKDKV